MAREVLITLEEWDQMQAMEAAGDQAADEVSQDEDGELEYEYEYEYDEDPDQLDGVPEEMPGEYRS